MTPKMAKKIESLERKLIAAIFLEKDQEKVADCMSALYNHGYDRERELMEKGRNFLRQSQISQN